MACFSCFTAEMVIYTFNFHWKSCMTELSRNLLREEDSGSSTVPRPHFILALRDFTLRMQMDGREITPDDYLAGILKINSTDEEEVRRPRESIIIFFPIRKCFIFERPGNGWVTTSVHLRLNGYYFWTRKVFLQGLGSNFIHYTDFGLTPQKCSDVILVVSVGQWVFCKTLQN